MKKFYQFLVNTIFASVMNMTVWFAIIFYVYLQTKSVFATSMMSGVYLAIVAVTGVWFGSLVDNHDKKKLIVYSSIFSLCVYSIGFLLYANVDTTAFSSINSPLLWLFILLLLVGVVAGNIRNIALPTVITALVSPDQRDKANGLAGTANGIGFLITSVISGFLVGLAGMYWVLILAVIVTVVAILHLNTLQISSDKDTVPPKDSSAKTTTDKPAKTNHLDLKGTLLAIGSVPGLYALIVFTMVNNFLGGVFMALMDAYGLSLVPVQTWGLLWGVLSTAFIIGGGLITRFGLGKNPLKTMFLANSIIWSISCVFTVYPSIVLLAVGLFLYMAVVPFIQASEFTIIQKVVPPERQGRVFGFAQSVEQAASPLTAFAIGPIAEFFFIPFMTTGAGVRLIGSWFGTGPDRGIALVFTLAGIIGLLTTLLAMRSKQYRLLTKSFLQ